MKKIICLFIFTIFIFQNSFALIADTHTDFYKYYKGKTICINAGHQKKGNLELEDSSPVINKKKAKVTYGANGESKINLTVSKILKEEFEALGAKVIMIRETEDVNISNKERALMGNKADLVLNIHCNAADNQKAAGIWLLIPSEKNVGEKSICEPSKKLASLIEKQMSKTHTVKTFERYDLTGLNWSTVPSIFIECGFLTNKDDKKFLENMDSYLTSDMRYDFIDSIMIGVTDFLKEDYVEEEIVEEDNKLLDDNFIISLIFSLFGLRR